MSLPPLQSNYNSEVYICGDVTIAPSAAIASGVILQAAPNYRIVIGAGVCIGMGAVIHASSGTIEIEAGATVGAGVIVVGEAKIGEKACVGSLTTVMSSHVEAERAIAAGSILGDTSRQISPDSSSSSNSQPVEEEESSEPASIQQATTLQPPMYTTAPPRYTSPTYQAPALSSPSSLPLVEEPDLPSISNSSEERSASVTPPSPQHNGSVVPELQKTVNEENSIVLERAGLEENPPQPPFERGEENSGNSSQLAFPRGEENLRNSYQPASETGEENLGNSYQPASESGENNLGNSQPVLESGELERAETAVENQSQGRSAQNTKSRVSGQDYVQQMMKTLFPHKSIPLSPEDEED